MPHPTIRAAAAIAGTLFAATLHAQTFERALGTPAATERANFIAPTASGGYIITGGDSSSGFNAPYITMVDASDFLVWQRTYTGGSGNRVVQDVIESPTGEVVCTAGDDEFAGFGRAIFKLNAAGAILWRSRYEGSSTLADIKLDRVPGGGYAFTGGYTLQGTNSLYPMLTLVDENGGMIWNRIYVHDDLGIDTNAKFEDVRAVTDEATGELAFIVCGTYSVVGAPNDEGRALVMKLKSDGDIEWACSYGFEDNTLLEAINLDIATNGDIILCCNDLGVGSSSASSLLRLDSNGSVLWSTAYENFGTGGSMTQLPSGDIIMCGRTRNPAIPGGQAETVLLKADAGGVLQWARAYGGAGFAFGLDAAPVPGGFVCIGTKITGNPSGTADIQWVRTDANGRTGCESDEPIIQVSRTPMKALEPFQSDTISGSNPFVLVEDPITYVSVDVCDELPCPTCACDWAAPIGVCDFNDVIAYLGAFVTGDPCANIDPAGVLDFNDVVLFLQQFAEGCP